MSASTAVSKNPLVAQPIALGDCRLCGVSGRTTVVVKGEEKRLVRCQSCKAVFLEPPPDEVTFTTEFEERHITSDDRLEEFFGAKRDPVLSFVARRIRQNKKRGHVLDVGCAGGHFLDYFFTASDWQKSGAEPSRFAAARAREKGISIYQGPLATVELPNSAFDVITALGVLMYFREPRNELGKLRKALRPGGILVIELPLAEAQLWRNSSKLSRIVIGKSRSLLGSGHLFYYNVASLAFLLRQAGFRVNEMLPVPAMKQRNSYQDLLSGVYYCASRSIWALSGGHMMLGPDFLALASPA
jgi:SAM-dependent methyltransferase